VTHSRSDAAIAFIDLAGFSAATDVYGDERAFQMLQLFEDIVHKALGESGSLKWIGDEVMLAFDDCPACLSLLGAILTQCRTERRLPLTRTGVHSGSVLRRDGDVFGSTVNIAARLTALANPGELLTTQSIADAAIASGIAVEDRGEHQLRSVSNPLRVFSIAVAPAADPRWIDPVCRCMRRWRRIGKLTERSGSARGVVLRLIGGIQPLTRKIDSAGYELCVSSWPNSKIAVTSVSQLLPKTYWRSFWRSSGKASLMWTVSLTARLFGPFDPFLAPFGACLPCALGATARSYLM